MIKQKSILIATNDTTFLYNLRIEIVEELCNRGYNVIVVTKFLDYVDEIRNTGCTLFNLNIPRRGKNPIDDLRLYKEIYNILLRYNPDIVFSNSIKPNVYFGISTSKLGIPFIPNITGLGGALLSKGLVNKIASSLYKKGIKNSKAVFFQNKYNKDFFYNNKILKKSKSYVLLPGSGINLDKFKYSDYPESENVVRFIMISRIMEDKGIEEYINAAENIKLRYPNTEFILVGEYDDVRYKSRIESLNNNDIINYLGYRKDIPKLIEKSHCLIHPSYHEGLSNVLLEAGAIGRPVIASDIPGCIETFKDGESGLAIKVKDSEDLIKKIEKFIALSYETKDQMGKANRAHIEKNFDRRIVVDKYIECIEKYAN